MSGIYLKCDVCGAEFPPPKHPLVGVTFSDEPLLRDSAAEAGWTRIGQDDHCPMCSQQDKKE